jgi:hypothetical protein
MRRVAIFKPALRTALQWPRDAARRRVRCGDLRCRGRVRDAHARLRAARLRDEQPCRRVRAGSAHRLGAASRARPPARRPLAGAAVELRPHARRQPCSGSRLCPPGSPGVEGVTAWPSSVAQLATRIVPAGVALGRWDAPSPCQGSCAADVADLKPWTSAERPIFSERAVVHAPAITRAHSGPAYIPAVSGNRDFAILKSDTSTVASMCRYTAASRKYFSTPTSSIAP